MPEMHLKQLGFVHRAWGIFTKSKRKKQKISKTGYSKYIYQKKVDKPCFEHDMAYGHFKYLSRRTAFNKLLHDKAFNITKNPR